MTKYQLFDECYGAFGEIYATESEAKNALESVIAEYFVDTAVGMAIREEQAADYNYREPRQIRHEEVVAEIRRSIFINEVEVADPEPEQADIARLFLATNLTALACIERERLAWNAAALRLGGRCY